MVYFMVYSSAPYLGFLERENRVFILIKLTTTRKQQRELQWWFCLISTDHGKKRSIHSWVTQKKTKVFTFINLIIGLPEFDLHKISWALKVWESLVYFMNKRHFKNCLHVFSGLLLHYCQAFECTSVKICLLAFQHCTHIIVCSPPSLMLFILSFS